MTKADQIRNLAAQGLSRSQIAAKVGVRYQHVYNVLKRSDTENLPRAQSQELSSNEAQVLAPAINVAELLSRGFKVAGAWHLIGTDAIGFDGELPRSPGVYAFALDDEIVYVGVSERNLRQRINFYVRPGPRQRTSIRIKGLVIDALKAGRSVTLSVTIPEDGSWNDYSIPMHTAVEAGLIKRLRPKWNKQGL